MKKEKNKLFLRNAHYIKLFLVAAACIVFFVLLTHFDTAAAIISAILSVFSPIIIGLGCAFIINLPLRFFERVVFGKLTRRNGKIWSKLKRAVCLLLSVILILSILVLILVFVMPTFISACTDFFTQLPTHVQSLNNTISNLLPGNEIDIDVWSAISDAALSFLTQDNSTIAGGLLNILVSLFNGIVNFILGFAISIYILASKEKLGKLAKSIIYALTDRKKARRIISITQLSNKAFAGFITGQCLEAITVGILCFVGMIIFQFPFSISLMIACIIAVTAFIPIFGPFIGTGIGAFIILIDSINGGPIRALVFTVFIIIMQQLESNIIYPKIMGKQVGLPGIWVLIAVTIGGGFFGVVGIILSVPICSVIYTLLNKWIIERLEEKNICHVTMSHDASEPNSLVVEVTEAEEVTISADDIKEIIEVNIAAKEAMESEELRTGTEAKESTEQENSESPSEEVEDTQNESSDK